MSTPSPKFFCPRCRAGFDFDSNFCGRCGADMHRASRLDLAQATAAAQNPDDESDESEPDDTGDDDRPSDELFYDRRVSASRDFWLGRVVDGRYRVVEAIGRGGMGVVYKVEHRRLGKIAAMKVLHRDLASDPEVVGRFHREAEAISRLTHPNTVQVFDFGSAEDGLYLVMEYVRGRDLGDILDRDGPMALSRAAPIVAQICAALAEAHDLGVVHRDLKPENVIVTRTHGGRDFVKVLDFGLAKIGEREEDSEVTNRGSIVGTPYYMSPEQIRGENIDARSDIYSLGALMYRVLTDENVFSSKTPVGVLTKHLTDKPAPPSTRFPELAIDPQVDDILLRALEKRPADRFASAVEMSAAVEEAFSELCTDAASSAPLAPGAISSSILRHVPRSGSATTSDINFGIESQLRLRRSDIDRYESRLRRRRVINAFLVPVLLAVFAGTGYYVFVWLKNQPRTSEHEPNNHLDEATLIASGTEVTGLLGKRMTTTTPDQDFYALEQTADPEGDHVISAEVSGLPNIDLELYVYDREGEIVAHANSGGVGHGEHIHRSRVKRSVFLLVTEAMPAGPKLPTENVSDQYTLKATLSPVDARLEIEPNDTAETATPIHPGAAISGHVDRGDERDAFRFRGPPGDYRVTVSGSENAGLSWRVGDSAPRPLGAASLELTTGDTIRIERATGASASDPEAPYTIDIAPDGAHGAPGHGHDHAH